MGRSAIRQGFQQKPELLLSFLLTDAQQGENSLLHVLAVNSDTATTQFDAVQHNIVGKRPHLAWVGLKQG